jgi:hypothetical protein
VSTAPCVISSCHYPLTSSCAAETVPADHADVLPDAIIIAVARNPEENWTIAGNGLARSGVLRTISFGPGSPFDQAHGRFAVVANPAA